MRTGDWPPGPRAPTLSEGEIHVWRASLDAVPSSTTRGLESLLSPEELHESRRFAFVADRCRFIVARALLRTVLSRYVGRDPAGLPLRRTPEGKPQLGEPLEGRLQFNVSHTREIALYAIGGDRDVGVDVERIRPGLTADVLDSGVLVADDTERLRTLRGAARDDATFAAWTRREAYAKARGVGLGLLDRGEAPGPEWTVEEIPVGREHRAALAVAGAIRRVRYWTLDVGGAVGSR